MAVSISEFQLDGYRGGNPLRVLDLGSGLNVALVRNEAGRTPLLQVIPWTLFGPGNFFPTAEDGDDGDLPLPPGRSGSARIRSDHGVFWVERQWEDTEGSLPRMTANDGQPCDPEYLDNILEGLPPKSYREIFTFDLARLRRLVHDGPYGEDRLTRLAAYLQRKSPQNSVAESTPIDHLPDIQSQMKDLTDLIQHLAVADSEVASAPEDPDKLKRQLAKLDSEIAESKAKQKHMQSEISETQCAISANRVIGRLNDIDRELSDSRPSKVARQTATIDEDAAARLDDKLETLRQELKELQSEREDLKRQGRELGNLKKMAQLAPQLDAVLLQEKMLMREEAAIEQMVQNLQDLEAQSEAERREAGNKAERLAIAPRSESPATARMDALSERLRESDHEIRTAEDRLVRAEATGNLAAENVARASAFAAHPEDAVAIHEAEERLIGLRERAGLDDQLQRLETERDELNVRLRRLYARQLMPFQMMMALGMPFMIGVAMIIYGLVMTQGDTNWNLVILGFAAVLISTLIKLSLDRGTGDQLRSVRKRLSRINFQIGEIAAAREDFAATGLSLASQIEDAERELASLQTRFAAHETKIMPSSDRSYGASSIESARIQLNDARRRDQELKQLWRELMLELDLSPNLAPVHAREVLAERAAHAQTSPQLDDTRQLEFQIRQLRQELDRRRDWLTTLMGQCRQLVKELGLAPTGSGVAAQMDVLREAMHEHKDRMQLRRQLLRAIDRLRQKQVRVKENGRRAAEQRRKLDEDLRVRKEQSRTQSQMHADRVKRLEKQRETLQRELAEIRDRYGVEDQLPLVDLTDEELESRLTNQKGRLAKLLDRLVRQSEQRGRVSAQRQQNSNGASGALPRSSRDDILQKARALTENYQSRLSTLAGSTHRYQYLEQAAGYLRELSAGQFVDLEVSREGVLLLTSHAGSVTKLGELRREHHANIYFSLWLARLEAYASRGLTLPIVMEDPLAATDPSRRPMVAQMLTDFAARGYQVILITSEPDNAELFAQLDVPIADLSELETGSLTPESPPTDEFTHAESKEQNEQPLPAAVVDAHEPLFPPH